MILSATPEGLLRDKDRRHAVVHLGDTPARLSGAPIARSYGMIARRIASATAVALLSFAAPAAAQEASAVSTAPASPPPAPAAAQVVAPSREVESQWYGWQVLVSDGLTVTSSIAIALTAEDHASFPYATYTNLAVGYSLAPPLIHLLHHRPLMALADIGVRGGLLALGVLIGGALDACTPNTSPAGDFTGCPVVGEFFGGLLGMLSGAVVDASALSWERVPTASASNAGSGFTVAPTVVLSQGHSGIGLSGTF
jgi:hypothetical protein